MRRSTKPHANLLGAVCFFVFSGAVSAGPVTVEIHNPTDRTLRDAPVTFGQVFRRGDMTNGVAVIARDGLGPTQVEVKRRYDDGSVRSAFLSTTVRELAPKGKIVLELVKANGMSPGVQVRRRGCWRPISTRSSRSAFPTAPCVGRIRPAHRCGDGNRCGDRHDRHVHGISNDPRVGRRVAVTCP